MEYFALTTKGDSSIIVNCPVCFRVMWKNGTCNHGVIPPPDKNAPKEEPRDLDGGTTRKGKYKSS